MVRMVGVMLAIWTLTACAVEDIGMGDGAIQVRNEDSAPVKVLISDSSECVVGLHSTIDGHTTRSFDVGENSVVCVGEKPPGVKVADGKSYVVSGGSIAEE